MKCNLFAVVIPMDPMSAVAIGSVTTSLETAVKAVMAEESRIADALKYLGPSHRKLSDYTKSLAFTKRAPAIKPNHEGASEYVGEAYLEPENLQGAEARRAHIAEACRHLVKSVAAFKARKDPMKQSSRRPPSAEPWVAGFPEA